MRGVANRAVATVLTAGLIAQPLMSPLAAIAAPTGDTTDAAKGESPIESTVVAGNQAVAKTAAQLAEESAKQFEAPRRPMMRLRRRLTPRARRRSRLSSKKTRLRRP